MEEDAIDISLAVPVSPTPPLPADADALAQRLPIPPNVPPVPGFDRYGFMETDMMASGSEALLRRIEKKVPATHTSQ
jgi:hypothetical protein